MERNSNIELLRIVLILFVLTLHLNNADYGGMFTIAEELESIWFKIFTRFTESFCICAVDCFLIISGYFSCVKKTSKIINVLNLIYVSVFFNAVNYILSVFMFGIHFRIGECMYALLPHRYFITFYCIVYVFSPYLNKLFVELSDKSKDIFLILFILVFSIYPTAIAVFKIPPVGLSSVSLSGNEGGYNIVTFILCYFVGAFLRHKEIKQKNSVLIPLYLLTTVVMARFPVFWNYDSPLCVLNAVFLFLIFKNFTVNSQVINYVAKSCFSVYVVHSLSIPLSLWQKYLAGMKNSISFCMRGGGIYKFHYASFPALRFYRFDSAKNRWANKRFVV